jgi:hypothetical protein
MTTRNTRVDPFMAVNNGKGPGFRVSAIASTKLGQDGLVYVSGHGDNRLVAVIDPSEMGEEYADKPELVLVELNRAVSQYSAGRPVVVPAWAIADLD